MLRRSEGEHQTLLSSSPSVDDDDNDFQTGTGGGTVKGLPPVNAIISYDSVVVNNDGSGEESEEDIEYIGRNNSSSDDSEGEDDEDLLPPWTLISILSTAFAYGCILTTLFLITLPVECARINVDHPGVPKSVALAFFVAVAGCTQLVSPIIGHLSDTYRPPMQDLGRRMPYHVLGSILTVIGLLGQLVASRKPAFWMNYALAFFFDMVGLNIMYAMMIALIPDQVPASQTGAANGILALLLVTGSLFGFALFYTFMSEDVHNMYSLYTCIVIVTSIMTGTNAHDRDAEIAGQRRRTSRYFRRRSSTEPTVSPPVSATAMLLSRRSKKGSFDRISRFAKKAASQTRRVARKTTHVVFVTPTVILKTMLVDPIREMSWETLYKSYTIEIDKHHDFFVVTVSRLFYYCGMSVQTFFMYFLVDIIRVPASDADSKVAILAILGQLSGAITCYPVGVVSDQCLSSRRKPFVYLSCAVLASCTTAIIFARTIHHMVIISLILGGANGVYLTMDTSLAIDTLPEESDDDEDGGGSGQLLGIWGVAAFLGSALGPMIGGPLLYLVGGHGGWTNVVDRNATAAAMTQAPLLPEAEAEEYSLAGYATILSLSSVYFLLSALSLRFIKNQKV